MFTRQSSGNYTVASVVHALYFFCLFEFVFLNLYEFHKKEDVSYPALIWCRFVFQKGKKLFEVQMKGSSSKNTHDCVFWGLSGVSSQQSSASPQTFGFLRWLAFSLRPSSPQYFLLVSSARRAEASALAKMEQSVSDKISKCQCVLLCKSPQTPRFSWSLLTRLDHSSILNSGSLSFFFSFSMVSWRACQSRNYCTL